MSWRFCLFLFAVSCPAGLIPSGLSAHRADGFWPGLPPTSAFLQEDSDWPGWVSCPPPNQSLWLKGFWFASLVHVLTLGTKKVSPGSLKSKGLNGIIKRWGTWLPREVCWQTPHGSPHGSFFCNTLHLSNVNLLSHVPSKPPKEENCQKRRGDRQPGHSLLDRWVFIFSLGEEWYHRLGIHSLLDLVNVLFTC